MNLGLLILLFCICAIWYETSTTREFVIASCKLHCHKNSLQLLDQTVALKSFKFLLDTGKNPVLWRKYIFEISRDGTDRCHGQIEIVNHQIELISVTDTDGTNVIYNNDHIRIQKH